jgi:hypothetical protein
MTATRITTSRVLDKRFISHLLSFIPDGINALLHRVHFNLTVGTEESQSIKTGAENRIQDSGFRPQEKDKKHRKVKKEIPRSSNLALRAYDW